MPTNRPAPADNHDVERAEAALSSAIITRISGPRPVRDRRWFGKTLFYTATLATGALVSMAGNAMLEKSGLKDELHAYRNPVAAVESAPQLIQWVQLPSSPFLEAGRQPDGTISIHHMLHAWNDAGLSHALVPSVIQRVNLLRPTLLGRADPVLELQLQTEAAKAARELADRHPGVLAALESGVPLERDGGWAHDIDRLASLLSDPTPEEDWSLEARVSQALAWNETEKGRSAPLVTPAILKPGLTEEGFCISTLMNTWRAAGMDPSMISEVLSSAKKALPVLDGLPEAIVQQRQEEALIATAHLNVLFREDQANIARLGKMNPGLEFPPAPVDEGWRQQDWDEFWDEMREEASSGVQPPPTGPAPTMEEARRALAQAVQVTGLRSLSPSLEAWNSPRELVRTAQRLEAANSQLETITGWKGKVLGLDGRVELSLGRPWSFNMLEGLVAADNAGRLQMSTTWHALGHEWFHGFEYVASRMVMGRSSARPLSENMQPLRSVAVPHVHGAMKDLLSATKEEMPTWKMNRERAARERDEYWLRPTEVLAFGFGSYIEQIHQASALTNLDRSRSMRHNEPERGPSVWEVEALDTPFQALFDAASSLELAGTQITVDPSDLQVSIAASVGEWRSARQEVSGGTISPSEKPGSRMRTYR